MFGRMSNILFRETLITHPNQCVRDLGVLAQDSSCIVSFIIILKCSSLLFSGLACSILKQNYQNKGPRAMGAGQKDASRNMLRSTGPIVEKGVLSVELRPSYCGR